MFFAVIKLVVYSSLASCPGSSPKECFLWKTPSPATPDTLPQGNHTLTFTHSLMSRHGLYAQGNHLAGELYKIVPNLTVNKRMPTPSDRETSKPVPRRTVLFKQTCASLAVIRPMARSSLASALALHQRNASYGKLLLRTLLAHCLKETTHLSENKTFSRFSRLLNSWFIVLSQLPWLFTIGMLLLENSFSSRS